MAADTATAAARRWGPLLVAAQFGLLAALAGAIALAGWPALPFGAALCAVAGALLGSWALTANRPGNFNIRPLPRAQGQLVTAGPYRWIRHPMYSALLLVAAAGVAWVPSGPTLALWALLAGVLWLKAGVEERALRACHPGYADYCRATRRFVPGLC
jgi:protein-S-isoprenylcysteine O-methyltransferase Ste14